MAVRKIIRMGHPTLREIARPLDKSEIGTENFLELIEDMRETLHEAGGIGLAAPQINKPVKVAVIEIETSSTRYGEIPTMPFTVYINPSIETLKPETAGFWEGCLSVPGLMGYVERPQHIGITYLDLNGEEQYLELEGFSATVFQHEFDHLNGILYVDRIKDPSLFSFDDEYHAFHQPVER